MIKLEQVKKTYRGPRGPVHALEAVDLQVAEGEFLAIRGPSGSGKSTLLLTIAGMIRPTSGSVVVQEHDMYGMSEAARAAFRARNVGFVFQMFHLVPYLTALQNVVLPSRLGNGGAGRQEAEALLVRLGLADRLHHRPEELSTGERQRTAIARALINEPWLLLADEPTGNLDYETGEQIMECLAEFHRGGRTVIMVTHDPAVEQHSQRTVQLRAGRL